MLVPALDAGLELRDIGEAEGLHEGEGWGGAVAGVAVDIVVFIFVEFGKLLGEFGTVEI